MAGDPNSRIHIDGLKPADVALLKSVADEAAQQAVNKTLIALGLDPTKPFEAQADMQFLRELRERCRSGTRQLLIVVVGIIVAGGAAWLWTGFKAALK